VCYLNAKTFAATNYFGADPSSTYPTALSTGIPGVMDPLAPTIITAMEWRWQTDMSPTTNMVQITNEDKFCFKADNTHDASCGANTTLSITAPNCVHQSSDLSTRSLMFTLGPKAAALPKCCTALRNAMHIAKRWGEPTWEHSACDGRYQDFPSCMVAGENSTSEYWVAPSLRNPNVTEHIYPSDLVGNFPDFKSFNESMHALAANNYECINEASIYTKANAATALNAAWGGETSQHVETAVRALVMSHIPPPTTTTTTTTSTEVSSANAVVTKVASAFTATETLPAGVTASDLIGSATYVDAKKTALSVALSGIAKDKITITGFVVSNRQLFMLENRRSLSTADKTVTTNFEIETPTAAAAAAVTSTLTATTFTATIKTELDTAIAAKDFSSDTFFASNPPVVKSVASVQTPVASAVTTSPSTTAAAAAPTAGAFTLGVSSTLFAIGCMVLF